MVSFPPKFLDSVVAIGKNTVKDDKWFATGFIYGYSRETSESNYRNFSKYLVTNRHVIESAIDEDPREILLRFNPLWGDEPQDITKKLYDENNNPEFTFHPDRDIDVAVFPIDYDSMSAVKEIKFIERPESMDIEQMKSQVSEGDFIYVAGFPMGIVGIKRKSTIIRSGCIARIGDLLRAENSEFLIDSNIFPGNSGGPVFTRPNNHSLNNTNLEKSFLIGMIKEYISYKDEAYSSQTGNLRVSFEENSGLASVVPIDHIHETINTHRNGNTRENNP